MLLGILSDTHDQLARTRVAVDLLVSHGAEALIHCGDFLGPEIVRACAVRPFYFVFGNNDGEGDLLAAAAETGATCLKWGGVVELAGHRLGVTHGHMRNDIKRLTAEGVDYLFTGHSHTKHDVMDGNVRRINPGALHRADAFTVAVLDLESGALKFLPVGR
jgi:putative phosphoesterase